MASKVTPHLMFDSVAKAEMNFYVSLFPDSEILKIEQYSPGEEGPEGSIKTAIFTVG